MGIRLPVDFAAMCKPKDQDDEHVVEDFVDDSIVPDSDPVLVHSCREFLNSGRPRVHGKSIERRTNASLDLEREPLEFA